jgi:Fe2+ transport system protein B
VIRLKGVEVDIIDLPGVYSLDPNAEAEGKVTHDFIYSGDYDFVINVVDASKIERDLIPDHAAEGSGAAAYW